MKFFILFLIEISYFFYYKYLKKHNSYIKKSIQLTKQAKYNKIKKWNIYQKFIEFLITFHVPLSEDTTHIEFTLPNN